MESVPDYDFEMLFLLQFSYAWVRLIHLVYSLQSDSFKAKWVHALHVS